MAATAERSQHIGFDEYYYETARKIALAPYIGRTALQENFAGVEQRKTDEVIDGIAEAIPGVVKNLRPYDVVDGVLVAEDGQPMEELLVNGVSHSMKLASGDSLLAQFGPSRARHELNEARLWQSMVNGEGGYNTLLVLSPYSEEYLTDETVVKLQRAGQEPKTKRAMLRIAHWDGQQLHVLTRSIDNSSVAMLQEASVRHDGYRYNAKNSTEMLGERRELNMGKEQVVNFARGLVVEADRLISQNIREQTIQGRPAREAHDTQQYVQSQQQIISSLVRISRQLASDHTTYESYKKAWEKQLYDHTALIKERMLGNDTRIIEDVGRAASASGVGAESRGETYNMCGTIISANGESRAGEGIGMESVKNLIGRKVTCPECKEKVEIPTSKLNEDILCCPDCKYEVEVCTGQVITKSQKGSNNPSSDRMSIYDVVAQEFSKNMRRIDSSIAVRKIAKQEKEELERAT